MLERVNPGSAILANLDSPTEGASESSSVLRISGWAWSQNGPQSIDVLIDDDLICSTTSGRHRPDVAEAMPWAADAMTSGFVADVPVAGLDDGPHTLSLVISDRARLTRTISREFVRVSAQTLYHAYFQAGLPGPDELTEAARVTSSVVSAPEFLFMIDGHREGDLAATVRSIRSQSYDAVECRIVAAAAQHESIAELIEERAGSARIEVLGKPALPRSSATGVRFIGLLEPGEELASGALALIGAAAATSDADIIYVDHDVVLPSGRHIEPSFKPDWSPEHLLSRDYVRGSYLVRDRPAHRRQLRAVLGERRGSWRLDLLLRLTDEPVGVVHIPRVLWSMPPSRGLLTAGDDEEAAAVRAALDRRAHPATVTKTGEPGIRRVKWALPEQSKVSIIIPTTGRIDLLRPCLDSLRARTSYKSYEILIIDNGRGRHRDGIAYARSQGCRILTRDEPFNWAKLNNDGARETDGPLLLFLNDDIEVVQDDWLDELASQAMRSGVGAVGSMLLYPDGRIQHAGVRLVGHGGGAMHLLHGLDPAGEIYQDLHRVTREVSAVTGACLMIRRGLFEELGRFDEDLAIVGNDIDLCLRSMARGYRNIWTPHSVLVHHESVSREDISIGADEQGMWGRWPELLAAGDPHSNPNLDGTRSDCATDWGRLAPQPTVTEGPADGHGVNLIGYIRAEMGVGEAARGLAYAMTAAGLPFTVIDYSAGNPARMGDESWLHKVTPDARYPIDVININADLIGDVIAGLPRQALIDRYIIGAWAWEMPEFPAIWLGAFDVVDEVWAPSVFVRDAIAARSPVPVTHIPYAVRIPQGPFFTREHLGLDDPRYLFLTMYDVNSVRARKNPEGAVRAFRDAFRPDDQSVGLVIKVNGSSATDAALIDEWTDGYPGIRVVDRTLSRSEVDSLLARCDAFVSLHRSEGFGLPIAEAMGLGKPVIATNWSGNADYMDETNAACVDHGFVTLDRDIGPYSAGQHWAEPDIGHAAWWMKQLRKDAALGKRLGTNGRRTVTSTLSPAAVGRLIVARVDAIRDEGMRSRRAYAGTNSLGRVNPSQAAKTRASSRS